MDQFQLRSFVVNVCEALGLSFFVTGSQASTAYGEPRFTNDLDVVVDLSPERVTAFCAHFPPDDFYVSEPAARAAVAAGGQFNILHPESGLKIDVMIPARSDFNASRFGRVVVEPQESGPPVHFASAEDVIVMKLRYFSEGGSEKHVRDIAAVLNTQRDRIDREYVARWAEHFGVGAAWRDIERQADAASGES